MAKIEKNKHRKNELTTLLNFPLKASVPAERRQPVRYRICYSASAMVIFFSLYGCINLGPDYAQPGLGVQTPQSYEYAPTETELLVAGDRWWEVFGDSELNLLVDEVLKNNWDIKQAAARILEARYQYVQVRAGRFPSADFDSSISRRQIGGGSLGSSTIANNYQLSGAAAFEVDLWSRLAKTSRAAWEDILIEEENRRTLAPAANLSPIETAVEISAGKPPCPCLDILIARFQNPRGCLLDVPVVFKDFTNQLIELLVTEYMPPAIPGHQQLGFSGRILIGFRRLNSQARLGVIGA